MTDDSETFDRLVEAEELQQDSERWRHTLAAVAALFGIVPFATAIAPSLPPAFIHAGTALWSAFVLGWVVLIIHGLVLERERRRLLRRLAAHPANHGSRR